jgi:hypothetical protein
MEMDEDEDDGCSSCVEGDRVGDGPITITRLINSGLLIGPPLK